MQVGVGQARAGGPAPRPPRSARLLWPLAAGLKEASDIDLYLKPLRVLLEEMEQVDYAQVPARCGHGTWLSQSPASLRQCSSRRSGQARPGH